MKVKYDGLADLQIFEKADFTKAGLDQGKLQFKQGEPVEVSDEVGQALISKEGLFGGHSFSEVQDEETAKGEAAEGNANLVNDPNDDPSGAEGEPPATSGDAQVAGRKGTSRSTAR